MIRFFLFGILLVMPVCAKEFNQVVIWGHKLHSHTHYYIHSAFFKAFSYMGYKTIWLDETDNLSSYNFDNSLFFTEGQVDKNIPHNPTSMYILHNCELSNYPSEVKNNRYLILQVYTHDVKKNKNAKKIAPFTYFDEKHRILYMPWATDLLPFEIDRNISHLASQKSNKKCVWVGTIGHGKFGNYNEINPFKLELEKKHIFFEHKTRISEEENQKVVFDAFLAPTIVGNWQKHHGYIPCRIFKNISYGQPGITNSKEAYLILNKTILYHPNTKKLASKALKYREKIKIKEIKKQMEIVRDHHTYLNRINTLLSTLERFQKLPR